MRIKHILFLLLFLGTLFSQDVSLVGVWNLKGQDQVNTFILNKDSTGYTSVDLGNGEDRTSELIWKTQKDSRYSDKNKGILILKFDDGSISMLNYLLISKDYVKDFFPNTEDLKKEYNYKNGNIMILWTVGKDLSDEDIIPRFYESF
jgi:hypothetical protein